MDLGFDAKVKVFQSIEEATFLKGMWYQVDPSEQSDFSHYWGPLPSRVLKATKSLRPPKSLYRGMSNTEASRQFLTDLAVGYSYYVQVPILRVMEKNFMDRPAVRSDLIEQYKVQAERIVKPKLSSAVLHTLMARYDFDEAELFSFETMFPKEPFKFFSHPLLTKLARVDYG